MTFSPVHLCHLLLCQHCTCVHFRRALESQAKRCFHISHRVTPIRTLRTQTTPTQPPQPHNHHTKTTTTTTTTNTQTDQHTNTATTPTQPPQPLLSPAPVSAACGSACLPTVLTRSYADVAACSHSGSTHFGSRTQHKANHNTSVWASFLCLCLERLP